MLLPLGLWLWLRQHGEATHLCARVPEEATHLRARVPEEVCPGPRAAPRASLDGKAAAGDISILSLSCSHPSVDSSRGRKGRGERGEERRAHVTACVGAFLVPGTLHIQPLPTKAVLETLRSANVHLVDKPRRKWHVLGSVPDSPAPDAQGCPLLPFPVLSPLEW